MSALTRKQFIAQAFAVIGCAPDDVLVSTDCGDYSPEEGRLEIDNTDTIGACGLLEYIEEQERNRDWQAELSVRSEFGEPRTSLGFLSVHGAIVATHYADADSECPDERLVLEFFPASSEADAAAWLDRKASEIFSEEAGNLTEIIEHLTGLFGRDRVQRAIDQALSGHS